MSRRYPILVAEGFQLLDLSGPVAVIEAASRMAGQIVRIEPVAARPGLVRSSCGVQIIAGPLGDPAGVDSLLVTGGTTASVVIGEAERQFLLGCAAHARRVASICTGAFVLAAAGLLNGHVATTHWEDADRLARDYPEVRVEPDRIYVRSGKFWTSAGVTAGIDLALALVAEDYGEAIAQAAAQMLVVPLRRLGGQSQFSGIVAMQRPDGRFVELLQQIRADLSADLSVEALSQRLAMSPRNFARAFRAETGKSPAKAVEQIRCEAARAMLQTGASVKEVARLCGFGDHERMRRAFRRRFDTAPATFKFLPTGLLC